MSEPTLSSPSLPRPTPRNAGVSSSTTMTAQSKAAVHYPFWFGGSASSMAACVTHPLDLVKVRLQVHNSKLPNTMSRTVLHILQNEGISGLYSGISASLLRQMTYSTVRFGVYEELKGNVTQRYGEPSFIALVGMSSLSGFLGGIAGNVADVLNVRMQHDSALAPHKRRNYKNALDGMVQMTRQEGLQSWFRGIWPNSTRAIFMTTGQLVSYDIFKGLLLKYTNMQDNLTTHLSSSFFASVVAATITNPVDVIKTRVMSSSTHEPLMKALRQICHTEGLYWMFRGWVPSFLRLGPQTICTFVFLELHRKVYRQISNPSQDEKAK